MPTATRLYFEAQGRAVHPDWGPYQRRENRGHNFVRSATVLAFPSPYSTIGNSDRCLDLCFELLSFEGERHPDAR